MQSSSIWVSSKKHCESDNQQWEQFYILLLSLLAHGWLDFTNDVLSSLKSRRNTAHAEDLLAGLPVWPLNVSNIRVFLLQMTFEASSSVTLLFDFWDVHTPAGENHVASLFSSGLIPRCGRRFKPVFWPPFMSRQVGLEEEQTSAQLLFEGVLSSVTAVV